MWKNNLLITVVGICIIFHSTNKMCYAQDQLAAYYIGGSAGEMSSPEYQSSFSLGIPISPEEMSSELYHSASGFTEVAFKNALFVPAKVTVLKFYDANANQINDDGLHLEGWIFNIIGDPSKSGITDITGNYTFAGLSSASYSVSEKSPIETNWVATTDTLKEIFVDWADSINIEFGNVCLGPGGGKTKGFWTNKNGQNLLKQNDPEWRNILNTATLRKSDGDEYDVPVAPATNFKDAYSSFENWLKKANATNMAYLLSSQYAAMLLNINYTGVESGDLVFVPGTTVSSHFYSIINLLNLVETELLAHGEVYITSPWRLIQMELKNALEGANSDLTFIQKNPCEYSFAVLKKNIKDEILNEIPTTYDLKQNYPNPFNPSTTIRYLIPEPSRVVIKVYDILGREVETLVDDEKPIGTFESVWNVTNLPSGIYFYRLQAGNFVETKKMVLLK